MSSKTRLTLSLPWVEKYRPVDLDDVVGNNEAISRFKLIAKEGSMPNILLSGPPGIGKTTSVLCLARTLLGPKVYKQAVLELNASDDRTLDVVRTKIKTFAKTKVTFDSNYPGKHKIIILDEADSITPAAQQALRRIMETNSDTTRFALACNDSTKIIEPIQSRCAIVRYTRLSDEEMLLRMQEVAKEEKVQISEDGWEALIFVSDGDMRNGLNAMQATWEGYNQVNSTNVFKVADLPHPKQIHELLQFCLKRQFADAHKRLTMIVKQGYAVIDIISTLARAVRNNPSKMIPEDLQLNYLKEIGRCHMIIVDGVETELQLAALIARLCKLVPPTV